MNEERFVNLMIQVPASFRRRLKVTAALQEKSIRELVMDAVARMVDEFERGHPPGR